MAKTAAGLLYLISIIYLLETAFDRPHGDAIINTPAVAVSVCHLVELQDSSGHSGEQCITLRICIVVMVF